MSYVETEFTQSVNTHSTHRFDSWMWSDLSQTTSDLRLWESSAHRKRHDSPWRFEFTQRHNGSWNNLFVFVWWGSSVWVQIHRKTQKKTLVRSDVYQFLFHLLLLSSPTPPHFILQLYFSFCVALCAFFPSLPPTDCLCCCQGRWKLSASRCRRDVIHVFPALWKTS